MDYDRSLQASFWLMVILQSIGAVDMPGSGPRKMPAPRAYVPVVIIWGVLQLAADAGWGRATAAIGWVVVLAGTVFGPSGKKLVNLFNVVASNISSKGGIGPVPGTSAPTPNPSNTAPSA